MPIHSITSLRRKNHGCAVGLLARHPGSGRHSSLRCDGPECKNGTGHGGTLFSTSQANLVLFSLPALSQRRAKRCWWWSRKSRFTKWWSPISTPAAQKQHSKLSRSVGDANRFPCHTIQKGPHGLRYFSTSDIPKKGHCGGEHGCSAATRGLGTQSLCDRNDHRHGACRRLGQLGGEMWPMSRPLAEDGAGGGRFC